jgi:lipoprotein-anchoring transpeptidase ErfK/SrfK
MNDFGRWMAAACGAALVTLGGCVVQDKTDEGEGQATTAQTQQPAAGGAQQPAQPAPQPTPPPPPPPDLRLEVNVAERELYVYRNDERIATHPVAVGTSEWPTQTGEWTIGQVVFNPRWTPPEEEWAKDEEVKEPGDPENPLGVAQLVYDAPRSIHGTNEPQSLGKAASHGSIRIANDVVVRLARMVMESGGASRDDAFFQQVRSNRRERVEVPIPNPIPIRVVSGGGSGGSSGDSGGDDKGGSGSEKSKSGSGN